MSNLKAISVLVACGCLSGCYYMQAAKGHIDLMSKREPIDQVLEDASTEPELARRLRLVTEAREFSITELKLPDNDSYRSYADLGRQQVLWNLFATEEFSMEPRTWCYPIVGCVAYRGYFNNDTARRKVEDLQEDGYDVAMGGVAAYSTLGRFNDPVLNTMMAWDDVHLIGVLFHELAHQVIYIKDDTTFNESFATAVEEAGLERWLASRGESERLASFHRRKALEKDIFELVDETRAELAVVYAGSDTEQMRRSKQAIFDDLSAAVAARLEESGLPARHWLVGDLNNAKLVPLALYESLVPAFKALLAQCGGDFDCFFSEVTRIGGYDVDQRNAELEGLARDARP
ncbi:MAG: aminopeptidase [Woeseiaceae bacterium]|nr:aminopeptidase [Woeseiaceae bacterium]